MLSEYPSFQDIVSSISTQLRLKSNRKLRTMESVFLTLIGKVMSVRPVPSNKILPAAQNFLTLSVPSPLTRPYI